MKRIYKIMILAVLTIACAFCFFACDNPRGEVKKGLIYTKFQGDAYYTVTGYVDDGTGVTILDIGEYNTEDVTIGRIKANAFSGNDTLKEIIVPTTVEKIDDGAFAKMNALESITLPFIGKTANSDAYYNESEQAEDKSVDSARNFAFIFGTSVSESTSAPTKRTEVTAVYGISSEGAENSFKSYLPLSLKKVSIQPASDYSIPMFAFAGINTIEEVVLGEHVVEIGERAFYNVSSLNKINLSSYIEKIYDYAFAGCNNLSGEYNLSSVFTVGEYAFRGTKITKITFGELLDSLGNYAFCSEMCEDADGDVEVQSYLREIDLSACIYLKKIGVGTFYHCDYLQKVTVNAALERICGFAFGYCASLNEIENLSQSTVCEPCWNIGSDGLVVNEG